MYLLDTNKLEVVLIREDTTPPYAILCHVWGDDEISLQAMQGLKANYMPQKGH